MPPWERVKPVLGLGAAGVAVLAWALAFETGEEGGEWTPHAELRGNGISIQGHDIETTAEREKRTQVRAKELRDDFGDLKKSVLGDRRRTRGEDVRAEGPELTPEIQYTPREVCQQMKLEYPEIYGSIDCMSELYDSPDPYWEAR